jgi:hypothetical protein
MTLLRITLEKASNARRGGTSETAQALESIKSAVVELPTCDEALWSKRLELRTKSEMGKPKRDQLSSNTDLGTRAKLSDQTSSGPFHLTSSSQVMTESA